MVRRLLVFSLLLSMVVCATSACTKKESGVAPTVVTNDATVAIIGGIKGGPAGPQTWQSHYGEVTLNGQLTDLGSSEQVSVGFAWGPSSVSSMAAGNSYQYQLTGTGTVAGSYAGVLYDPGLFEGNIAGAGYAQPDTTLYYRAFATSTDGTAWGDEHTFHTNPDTVLLSTNQNALYVGAILEVAGQSLNRTSQTLTYASVTATFKDAQGTILGTESSSTSDPIAPKTATYNGGLWTWVLRYSAPDALNVASYELSFSAG